LDLTAHTVEFVLVAPDNRDMRTERGQLDVIALWR
jgi:hypothetical protein